MKYYKHITTPFASVFSHPYLFAGFLKKEIKGRFAGTLAGMLWTLISPLASIIIYLFIFSQVLRIEIHAAENGTDSFVIFFLSGFFPWLFFSEGLSRSVGILIQNANLISKVVFPVELLPACSVISAFVINGIGLAMFLIYLGFQGYAHPVWLLLFFLIPVQIVFIWGLANLLSAICVFIRDINELLPIILMVWFYATPVIYPLSMIPDALKPLVSMNPGFWFTELYRSVLIVHQMQWQIFFQMCSAAILSFAFGSWFFMRAKPAFGDVL
ncbi:MAG: ABC transporter permease [Desulfococcaceae bacterium]